MDNYPEIPLKALSIMQPWAWLIVNGHKDIENRDWATKFRGPVAIHAGKKMDKDCAWELDCGRHPVTGASDRRFVSEQFDGYMCGGIVGIAEIVDCVPSGTSPWRPEYSEWFVGKYGFVIKNARPVDFIPVRGALGFFDWRNHR